MAQQKREEAERKAAEEEEQKRAATKKKLASAGKKLFAAASLHSKPMLARSATTSDLAAAPAPIKGSQNSKPKLARSATAALKAPEPEAGRPRKKEILTAEEKEARFASEFALKRKHALRTAGDMRLHGCVMFDHVRYADQMIDRSKSGELVPGHGCARSLQSNRFGRLLAQTMSHHVDQKTISGRISHAWLSCLL